MRLNEKNVASFAVCSSPVDKEGYLQKKGDLNRDFQKRWFVLKGNLLFYFLKKQDREPQGVIVLEACSVQVSNYGRYCFEISFDGTGTRVYILGANNNDELEFWMKAISHASYEYLKSIVDELQRRVNLLSSSSSQTDTSGLDGIKAGAVTTATSSASHMSMSIVGMQEMVTLQDLSNPIAPMQQKRYSSPAISTTKIKKGVLVDISVDDEAPPLPAKKLRKSLTMNPSDEMTVRGSSYTDGLLQHQKEMDALVLEAPLHSSVSTRGHSAINPPHTHVSPFSSPLVPKIPLENSDEPLSPPAVLDRTAILQPLQAYVNINNTTQNLESDIAKLKVGEQDGGNTMTCMHETTPGGDVMPFSHPPQASCKKLSAPLDPSKTFMEMHQDFTEAMKMLNAERTSASYSPP